MWIAPAVVFRDRQYFLGVGRGGGRILASLQHNVWALKYALKYWDRHIFQVWGEGGGLIAPFTFSMAVGDRGDFRTCLSSTVASQVLFPNSKWIAICIYYK